MRQRLAKADPVNATGSGVRDNRHVGQLLPALSGAHNGSLVFPRGRGSEPVLQASGCVSAAQLRMWVPRPLPVIQIFSVAVMRRKWVRDINSWEEKWRRKDEQKAEHVSINRDVTHWFETSSLTSCPAPCLEEQGVEPN
ncbi:unnamed protein product [Pleuronectes platessa]|uniref:Uncharacterized protein n=1 Tax=Pleuronectes platessa TaxID=8262 RepID=A0A9N7YHT2_PLEPL|nr:unnamed protein product [Pleuronectes platessa]